VKGLAGAIASPVTSVVGVVSGVVVDKVASPAIALAWKPVDAGLTSVSSAASLVGSSISSAKELVDPYVEPTLSFLSDNGLYVAAAMLVAMVMFVMHMESDSPRMEGPVHRHYDTPVAARKVMKAHAEQPRTIPASISLDASEMTKQTADITAGSSGGISSNDDSSVNSEEEAIAAAAATGAAEMMPQNDEDDDDDQSVEHSYQEFAITMSKSHDETETKEMKDIQVEKTQGPPSVMSEPPAPSSPARGTKQTKKGKSMKKRLSGIKKTLSSNNLVGKKKDEKSGSRTADPSFSSAD
jgi:hypothetical protein